MTLVNNNIHSNVLLQTSTFDHPQDWSTSAKISLIATQFCQKAFNRASSSPTKKVEAVEITSTSNAPSLVGKATGIISQNPSMIDDPLQKRYHEMTRRIKKAEKENLTAKMASIPDMQAHVEELTNALNQSKLSAEIFKSPNMPFYALKALELGMIDKYQFGTIMLRWSIGEYHQGFEQMEIYSLFLENGQVNPNTFEVIKLTFPENFNEQQTLEFLEEMKKVPPSEQFFFIVPDIQNSISVSQAINALGINTFCRLEGLLQSNKRIIPSLSMMQAFLNVKYGQNAVKINPVLGISSFNDMRKVDARDMALHFPGTSLPSEADGLPAPWYDFSFHDFYHAIVVSSIPTAYRAMMIEIALLALNTMKESGFARKSPSGETLHSLFAAAIDMETPYFMRETSAPANLVFFHEIKTVFYKAFHLDDYENFDLETALLFLRKVAKKLIIDGDGKELDLTQKALEQAISNFTELPLEYDSTVKHINPLAFMLEYVNLPDKDFFKEIDPNFLLALAKSKRERFLPKPKQSISQDRAERLNNFIINNLHLIKRNKDTKPLQSLLQSISDDQSDEIHKWRWQITLLMKAGASFDQIIHLEPQQRLELYAKAEMVAVLLLEGVSLKNIVRKSIEQHIEFLKGTFYIPENSNSETEYHHYLQLVGKENQSHIAVAKMIGPSVFTQLPDGVKNSLSDLFLDSKNPRFFIPDGSNVEIERQIFANIISEGNRTHILVAKAIGPSVFAQLPELSFSGRRSVKPEHMSHPIMRYGKMVVCRYVIRTEDSSIYACGAIADAGDGKPFFTSTSGLFKGYGTNAQIDFLTRLFSHQTCGIFEVNEEYRYVEGERMLEDGRSVVELQ